MSDAYSIKEARDCLDDLVRRATQHGDRIAITDQGRTLAVLISPQELEDLEDELAVAEYRLCKANGTFVGIPHEEVRARLGLPPSPTDLPPSPTERT
ncbi:type II toxin-antitoxin system Phd/YefM family antitoxin [Streptomyces sp. PSKA54]|uniref:Antitoxin n=1 Tax=Streptomyces himalayensis subsp. aureolus TaxID=2758039 RepID=A0A7W2D5Z1_9ACTN|nr:type II toxin-antitoxin system Phd/YefM family antitoxin [Streptomyces himalayensis]MBA4865369.1 type II toxin-antitoxin system Phd/YefM family antitoxin [Streptomyces himalayensis subsp. aureolus]